MQILVRRIFTWKYTAYILAALGGLLYCALSIHYALTQRSTIDEGLYLYKGYHFALGEYFPYQKNGFRTLYTPLAYFIPGWAQLLFGPGLFTGRILEVSLGVLALIGLWLLARRLAGNGWAAAAVWAAALNPGGLRTYSFGVVQATVICLLIWALVFSLHRQRDLWQIPLGAALAGLLLLTRQDMAPFLPLLSLYLFWEYGGKVGWLSALAGAAVVAAGHAFFWPGILKIWADWLPARLTPFLNAWRVPAGAVPQLNTPPDINARVSGLLEGLRFHFISVTSFTLSLVFWPGRASWKTSSHFRAAVFLAGLFGILLGLHLWAGLGFSAANGFNASTFSTYLALFGYLGILTLLAVLGTLRKRVGPARQVAAALIVLLFSLGIGYGGFDIFGNALTAIKIPRLKTLLNTGHLAPSEVPLWDFLSSRFGFSLYESNLRVSGLAGLIVGILILLAAIGLWKWLARRKPASYSYGWVALALFLLIGAVLTPTRLLGGGFTQWDCGGNVIRTYEAVGRALSERIPPSSRLYWNGGNAVAVLLYTPGVRLFPPQIDDKWNFFFGGDSQTLARLGNWNEDLAAQWRNQADVFIFQQVDYSVWEGYVNTADYEEVSQLPQIPLNCEPDTYLRAFVRKNKGY